MIISCNPDKNNHTLFLVNVSCGTMAKRKISPLCSKCGGLKEKNRIGRQPYCRKCHAEYMRLNRPKYSELTLEQKIKGNARSYARVYLTRGYIQQRPCEVCGSFDSQMHHKDYSKPTEITWLCRRHHLIEHGHNPK